MSMEILTEAITKMCANLGIIEESIVLEAGPTLLLLLKDVEAQAAKAAVYRNHLENLLVGCNEANIETGVCCCGESMENHNSWELGHSAVDSSYYMHKTIQSAMAELYGTPLEQTGDMPLYRCHKVVRALKIESIVDGWMQFKNHPPIEVSTAWGQKHNPQPGGYYVIYEDGYISFSPAKAFESGYRRI